MLYLKLSKVLQTEKFTCLKFNSSPFMWQRDNVRVIIPVFTDEITISVPSNADIDQITDRWVAREPKERYVPDISFPRPARPFCM